MHFRTVILFPTLFAFTVGLFLLDLAVGVVHIPVDDVWTAVTGGNCPRKSS
jgi:iron complex transport system permease protein